MKPTINSAHDDKPGPRWRRRLVRVVVICTLGLSLMSPAARRWPNARSEYSRDFGGKLRCLRDCLWLGYGLYSPPTNHIRLASSSLLTVQVNPERLDMRTSAGMGECASIAENESGVVFTAWMMRDDRNSQSYKVYGRILSASGAPVGTDFRVNTGISSGMMAHHVSLRVDAAGWFYVLWHAARSTSELVHGGAGVFLRVYDPAGRPGPAEFQISPELRGAMPELAVNADGTAAAVWSDRGQIWGRLLSRDGPTGPAVRVDDTPLGAMAEFPAIAFGPDGRLFAAWTDTRAGRRDVYARMLGSSLIPLHATIKVGDGPVPAAFFRLISVAGTSKGYSVLWLRPGEQAGKWFDVNGHSSSSGNGSVVSVLPATSEVATMALRDGGVLASNGRYIRDWYPDHVGAEIPLLTPPSRPSELNLAPGRLGIWVAWHDSLDARRVPALGDNFFIMAARVSLSTVAPGVANKF